MQWLHSLSDLVVIAGFLLGYLWVPRKLSKWIESNNRLVKLEPILTKLAPFLEHLSTELKPNGGSSMKDQVTKILSETGKQTTTLDAVAKKVGAEQ